MVVGLSSFLIVDQRLSLRKERVTKKAEQGSSAFLVLVRQRWLA